MTPKKGTGHTWNGRGRELQALLDSTVVQITDKDDTAGQIPWRTSRRLQEATFRSLTRDRDVDNALSVKKEKESPQNLSVRLPKRQRSPSSHLEIFLTEALEGEDGGGEACSSQSNSPKSIVVNGESGKRKRRTVHFSDPLFIYIEDKKQREITSKPVIDRRANQQSRNENTGLSNVGGPQQPKQPLSCFDLLCNYSGVKGWRCYRTCLQGESFCNFHISSRKTASIVRISVCA